MLATLDICSKTWGSGISEKDKVDCEDQFTHGIRNELKASKRKGLIVSARE